MNISEKLSILADAAKYDASCASSGAEKRNSRNTGGIGSTNSMGICHSYTPDGRCISLLKVLLTNFCVYECSYCVNRASSAVQRARFTVDEVVKLTLDFYKRNYIEGLFLSSGIIQNADYTMEEVISVAKKLREEHNFQGYIHLKTIPEASEELLVEAGYYADRLSINVELPTEEGLKTLAPEKNHQRIEHTMLRFRGAIENYKQEAKQVKKVSNVRRKAKKFSPSGQSTQMIIGADQASDMDILQKSSHLYSSFRLKRVYYSAFSPIPYASRALPLKPPPLVREHRLYQADWLLRFYGFKIDDLNNSLDSRKMLNLHLDPKLSWALGSRQHFPVDLNKADYEAILKVPGIGVQTALKIVTQRQYGKKLRMQDLLKYRVDWEKVKHFVVLKDYRPPRDIASDHLAQQFSASSAQYSLF